MDPERVRFVVLKFGGTSVSSAENWRTIESVLRERLADGLRPVVVCSALSGITDGLEGIVDRCLDPDFDSTSQRDAVDRLRRRHLAFLEELTDRDGGAEARFEIEQCLEQLSQWILGATLVGEVSPRIEARILCVGELLSTWIATAFLRGSGLSTHRADARDHLFAVDEVRDSTGEELSVRSFVSADCDFGPDLSLVERWSGLDEQVVVTQGFLCSRGSGETAVLGRGGSDTSATYFAAKLSAERCEIWTDVPGIFTANPREIPGARLLRGLEVDEAQEIATMGAKVLHPRCLGPARQYSIPVEIHCTAHPGAEGTTISSSSGSGEARVKAISAKSGVTLVSMSTFGMWQQAGFLADVFACFKRHGISVDLVSTSETNVTASIDTDSQSVGEGELADLRRDLGQLCQVQLIDSCAAVSLVGRNIRAILHKLGPVLEVFEEQRIHLVSQAASDLNFTFVVDEDQAHRLVRELHALLFHAGDQLLGPTWEELFGSTGATQSTVEAAWWITRRDLLVDIASKGTPSYVYDEATVDRSARQLRVLSSIDRVLYAMKANPHPDLLRCLFSHGIGFECVSPGEVERVREAAPGVAAEDILFTPNFASPEEYSWAFEHGVQITVDNVELLERQLDLFSGRSIFLRIDPGRGQGHHPYVRTAGPESKFGISLDQIERVQNLVCSHGIEVAGLHAHAGSGIRTSESWRDTALFLIGVAELFPRVSVLDLGGGLGVVERPDQTPLDLKEMNAALTEVRDAHPQYRLWLEPGRFLAATAGVIVATVTQVKVKSGVRYVGIDAGMHTLIRPALYGAHHEIVNLSRVGEESTWVAHVVGPICETGDTLGYGRHLPVTEPGDCLLIATTGAYGRAMSSNYNLRGPAPEVWLPRDAL